MSKRSPLGFTLFLPLSLALMTFILDSAKESTSSGILSAAVKQEAKSDSSAAIVAAKPMLLSSKSRLRVWALKFSTVLYASTTSGRHAIRICSNSAASLSAIIVS